jgi:hypothetical protein
VLTDRIQGGRCKAVTVFTFFARSRYDKLAFCRSSIIYAATLNSSSKAYIDSGFRYGGDEFSIILPDTDKNQAKVAAERISKQFGAFKFGRVSLSIGIAGAVPGEDEKSIVKCADEALYTSKHEGRNRITLEPEPPPPEAPPPPPAT